MNENTVPDIPIACVLSSDELMGRSGAWRALPRTSMVAQERVWGGLRHMARPDAELNALVDLERDCSRWITLVVNGESVTTMAQGEGEVLVQLLSVTRLMPRTDGFHEYD